MNQPQQATQPPDPPTLEHRKAVAEHIVHEVFALIQARDLHDHARKQKQIATNETDKDVYQVGINCAIESFLLHYRSLREFLNDNAKRKDKDKSLNKRITDDIKATDYTIDPSWKPSHGWVSDKKEGERIHKRLAHITTARLTLNDQWYPDAMEWQALKTFEEFVAVISASEQQWFTKATEIINQRQPKVLATLGESSGTQTVNRYPIDLTTFRFK